MCLHLEDPKNTIGGLQKDRSHIEKVEKAVLYQKESFSQLHSNQNPVYLLYVGDYTI